MTSVKNLRKLSFLVYGLGLSGKSVVNFFKKKKIQNFLVWDDKNKDLFLSKRPKNLVKIINEVDYIILSPGINLNKSKYSKELTKNKRKILTDLDLLFLFYKNIKSVVVTGTNGKSTTCKIIEHVLKKNSFKALLGGNIGTPVLNLKIKKRSFVIIEASSYQLAYSKFIHPNFAILLNITNDHLDWHGNMKNYINAKFKIFSLQRKKDFSIIHNKLAKKFKKRRLKGKLFLPDIAAFKKIKPKINKNIFIKSNINDENISFVFALSKILKISEKSFIKSLKSFVGLPHRYEIFLKRKDNVFINDSKATSFQATKLALQNSTNIFWIVGGLPKKDDKIDFRNFRKNIIKSYIIGNHTNFFKNQLKDKLNYCICKNIKKTIVQILKDIEFLKTKKNTILLSPAAASFDQYPNFEKRGEEFKRLSKLYARKFL